MKLTRKHLTASANKTFTDAEYWMTEGLRVDIENLFRKTNGMRTLRVTWHGFINPETHAASIQFLRDKLAWYKDQIRIEARNMNRAQKRHVARWVDTRSKQVNATIDFFESYPPNKRYLKNHKFYKRMWWQHISYADKENRLKGLTT